MADYLLVIHWPGFHASRPHDTFDLAIEDYIAVRQSLTNNVGPVAEHVMADNVGLVAYCHVKDNALIGAYIVRVR